MFTIRRYTEKDIEVMIQHTENFFSETRGEEYKNHFSAIKFDKLKLTKLLQSNVTNINFFANLIIVDKEIVGGLVAIIAQPIYTQQTIAYDQLLYTVPNFNDVKAVRKLIQSYVGWSERRGVFECHLCSSTGFKQDSFAILLKRAGFQQFEIGFSKRF